MKKLLAPHGLGAKGHRALIKLRGDVVMVAFEGALRQAYRPGEGVQFLVGDVAHHVRPDPPTRGPQRGINQDHNT